MVTRVEVGSEVMTADSTSSGTLNVEHSFSGNLVLLPLGDRVRRDAEMVSKSRLRTKDSKGLIEGTVTHIGEFIHRRLISINRCLIVPDPASHETKRMVDSPKPEHYPTFKDWLEAVRKARKQTKAAIAEIAGRSPQAATKWFNGGDVDPQPLRKIADWSGADYSSLRMLLDGQPVNGAKKTKGMTPASADVMRIARKLELLIGDDDGIESVEALIDHRLSRLQRPKKLGKQ